MLASLLGFFAMDPPAPLPATVSGNQFSAQRAGDAMAGLLQGMGTHPAGSPEAGRMRIRIADHLRLLGYQPEEQSQFAVGSGGTAGTIHNVFARRNGREAGPVLLCVAHYDSVWAGPGVSDDLSGVGVLLELARIQIESRRSRQPVVFLFTDAEEQGLVGAAGFLDHPLCEDVGLVLNFEARGGSGVAYMFETGRGNADLMRMYADCVSHPSAASLTTEIYKRLPNDTDFSFFRNAGLAGFNFAFIEDLHVYHTPLDDFAHLSLASLQHEGEQAAQLMERWLNQVPPPSGDGVGDVVHGSLPGGWMLLYGEGTARLVSLLCLLALVWAAQGCVARGRVSWGEVAGGLSVAGLCVLIGSVVSLLWSTGLRGLAGTSQPWLAQPLWLLGIQVGLALCLWWGVVVRWGHRVGRVGAVLGAALGWGLGALATALFLPGISFLFTPVALILTVTLYMTPWDVYLQSRLARGMTGVLPVAALLWIPAHRGLVAAAGPGVELALALPILLLGTCFMPLMIGIPTWMRRSLVGLGALVLCASSVGTLLAPAQSAGRPAKLNLVYAQDLPTTGEAQWQARTFGPPLPDAYAGGWTFTEYEPPEAEDLAPPPGWSGGRLFTSPAAHLGLTPPHLELDPGAWVGQGEDRGWRVSGTLYSGASRGRTSLRVLEAPGPVSLVVSGHSLGVRKRFTIMDIPQEGLPVEIWIGGGGEEEPESEPDGESLEEAEGLEVHLRLVDRRSGLPSAGADLLAARPPEFVPAHDGDGILVAAELKLTLPPPPTGEGEAE
ncbi:MAG: M28 family peptidase [bacterium]